MRFSLLLLPFVLLALLGAGCEHEGYLDTSDCRENIPIQEDSLESYLHNFSCVYNKNSDGRIKSGLCCAIDAAAFTNKCIKAYCYEKSAQIACGDGETVSSNGECVCKNGYLLSSKGNCELAKCPSHSSYQSNTKKCLCNQGYIANSDGTCITPDCQTNSHFSTALSACVCDSGYITESGECIKTHGAINSDSNNIIDQKSVFVSAVTDKSTTGDDIVNFVVTTIFLITVFGLAMVFVLPKKMKSHTTVEK